MNQLTNALAKAGVPLPTIKERLWRVIKDEPGLTATQLSKRLSGIPIGTISSQLNVMETRGMVYVVGTKGHGPTRKAKAYHTDMDTYQLLSAPKVGTTHKPAQKAVEPTADRDAFDLDALTIREAKALYVRLKGMFA